MSIRVLIADDHPTLRHGISQLLDSNGGIEVVGEAGTCEEVLSQVAALHPDVLLLDVRMPGLGAKQMLGALAETADPPKALVFSAYGDAENVLAMVEAGVSGYLLKTCSTGELLAAIQAVAHGGTWLSPALAGVFLPQAKKEERPEEELTAREREVLRWLARGCSNRQIAAGLGITERTVGFHMENILAKLGVSSRSAALIVASQRGWVSLGKPEMGEQAK